MTRGHRRAHLWIWPVLVIALVLGASAALVLRPPPDPPAAGARP